MAGRLHHKELGLGPGPLSISSSGATCGGRGGGHTKLNSDQTAGGRMRLKSKW